MLTELYRKSGRVCGPAREGRLRCPLIVRPTSEDVITGNLCLVLRAVDPRCWLAQLLNKSLGAQRFRQQVFRNLVIEPWQNQPRYPLELLPWVEGSTQVDLTIRWENPPTTVFIESKLLASPSTQVTGDTGGHGYPSDQLIRNIRVGLWEAGRFGPRESFIQKTRDFVFVLLGQYGGNPLVHRYRSRRELLRAIPHSRRLTQLPMRPFVGELSYHDVRSVLTSAMASTSRSERVLLDALTSYLAAKQNVQPNKSPRQRQLPGVETDEVHDHRK